MHEQTDGSIHYAARVEPASQMESKSTALADSSTVPINGNR